MVTNKVSYKLVKTFFKTDDQFEDQPTLEEKSKTLDR
jgi:hypothetical protein